jgi:hypothetical protein
LKYIQESKLKTSIKRQDDSEPVFSHEADILKIDKDIINLRKRLEAAALKQTNAIVYEVMESLKVIDVDD